jgi:hypothetical protein
VILGHRVKKIEIDGWHFKNWKLFQHCCLEFRLRHCKNKIKWNINGKGYHFCHLLILD